MPHVVNKTFLLLLCAFFLLASQTSYSQLGDGRVGNNNIPNTYEGFDHSSNPPLLESAGSGAPGGDPCESQDPFDPLCPVDDWVYILLFLGVSYGFVKFKKHKFSVV